MNKTGSITAEAVAAVVIIALAVLVIVGCVLGTVNDIDEGRVIDKACQNAYVSNDISISGNTVTPQVTYHPAVYQLQIEGYSADDKKVKNWIICTQEEYREYNIGDYFRR